MFHKARLAGHHHARTNSINSARVSNGLEPFDAPSGRSQVATAALIVLITLLFFVLAG